MLGLKVTAESKKNYIKKSCVVDKYRGMAGEGEISCKKGAENGGIVVPIQLACMHHRLRL